MIEFKNVGTEMVLKTILVKRVSSRHHSCIVVFSVPLVLLIWLELLLVTCLSKRLPLLMKNKFTLKLSEKSIDTNKRSSVSIKTTITNHISYSFNLASTSKIVRLYLFWQLLLSAYNPIFYADSWRQTKTS